MRLFLLSLCLVAAIPAAAAPPAPPVGTTTPAPAVPISLQSALDAADAGNIDLATALNARATAAARLRSANTAPNPLLSVNTVQVRPNRIGNLPYGQLADTIVRLDLPLERGGKRRARVGEASADLAAAGSDLADARRRVHAAVSDGFYALLAAEQRVALLRQIADTYNTAATVAERRLKAGALSGGDYARQRVEALRALSDVAEAEADRREAQLTLAILIGREADAAALTTLGAWPTAPPSLAEDPEEVADRRPDVLADRQRVEAARQGLAGAHALRHPDVTVGVQYERAAGDLGVGSSVGFGVALPIPVRNAYRGEVEAGEIAVTQAETQAAKTRAVAVAEITIARRAVADASARRLGFEAEQLPAARKAAAAAEFAYAQGAIALTDLLDARRTLTAVELAAIAARAEEARALARDAAAEARGAGATFSGDR